MSSPIEIALLIGSDHYWEFLTGRIQRGGEGPVAIETRLGWVLSGPVSSGEEDTTSTGLMTYILHVGAEYQETQELDGTLKSFWELESFGIPPNDKAVYDNFWEKIKLQNGRYEVALPWKTPHMTLPSNFKLCSKRLKGLLAHLRNEEDILREYDAVIRSQIEQGIVESVEPTADPDISGVHYLPHHAVVRRDKETTQLHIVYNASARSSGASLNDCLHAGPKFEQWIFDNLLRFRIHAIAFIANIEKAFKRYHLHPKTGSLCDFCG